MLCRTIAPLCTIALVLAAASCTTGTGSSPETTDTRAQSALARLEQRAEAAERRTSGPAADDLPPPFPSMAPIPRDSTVWGMADTPLDRVLRELLDPGDGSDADGLADSEDGSVSGEAVAVAGVTDEEHGRALVLYAEARQRSAADEHARAIRLLEEAAELDADSPEIWRALGDARRGAGFANSSGAAYARSAELGIGEPEALTLAGLHEASQGNTETAAAFLARALTSATPHADPLVAQIAAIALGEALLEMGRTKAGCEALDSGLRIGPAALVPTNLGVEAVAFRRRLADLLVRLGDARSSLGGHGLAADAYRRAAEQPGGDRPEIRARLVHALRLAGRDEAAALVLIDDLRAGGAVTPTMLEALTRVTRDIRPRSLVADAIAGLSPEGSVARASDLLLARAAALPDRDARSLLTRALAAQADDAHGPNDANSTKPALAARTEHGRSLVMSVLIERTPDADRVRDISRLVADRPALARPAVSALLLRSSDPGSLPNRLGAESDPGARSAMLVEHAMATQNHDRLTAALDEAMGRFEAAASTDGTEHHLDRLARLAALASALGRWDMYEQALASLRAIPEADRALLAALESGQRLTEAFPIAQRVVDAPDATTDDLLRLAAIAGQVGQAEAGRDALVRAAELDPFDVRVYNALLAFHGPGGPAPDGELRNEAARMLRQHAPGSTLLRQMIAAELIRRGLLDEATTRLASLFAEDPTQPQTLEAVLAFWTRLAGAERSDEIDLGPARAAQEHHPASPALARLLAGGELLLDRPGEAIAVIDAFETLTGSPALARLREQIIAEQLDDEERAEQLAIERLGPEPRSIDACLELAAHHAERLGGQEAEDERVGLILASLTAIPAQADLTRRQLGPVDSIVSAMAVHLRDRRQQTPDPLATEALASDGLAIIDWAARRSVALAPALHDMRLTLLAEADAPFERLAGAAEAAISAHPGSERAFARRLVDLLLARSRGDEASGWVRARVFTGDGSVDAEMLTEWIRVPLITADVGSARELIRYLDDRGALLDAWQSLRTGQAELPGRDGSSPAEFAYLLAQYAAGTADPEAVPAFLRLALEYDPRHPWVANDLGYRLLEGEGSVAEAERLIAIAYEQLSDEAAIVDSLGWARYHLGQLEDSTDPESGEIIPGAVTLLRKAAELAGDDDDGVVSDHLGDALFRSGRTDRALEAWSDAARQASRLMNRLRASGAANGLRLREIQSLAAAAAMKRNAVQLAQPPAVAPQRGVSDVDGRPDSQPADPPGTSP